MFSIDGMQWSYPCRIVRTAEVTASEISGLLLDKSYFNDVLGTYMSYEVTIAIPIGKESEYATIYEALTDPVDGHAFVFPYNSGTVQITGRVASVKDNYVRKPGGAVFWQGTTFTVVSNHPTKTMELDDVIARGFAPLPESGATAIPGAAYTYGDDGWTALFDADSYGY